MHAHADDPRLSSPFETWLRRRSSRTHAHKRVRIGENVSSSEKQQGWSRVNLVSGEGERANKAAKVRQKICNWHLRPSKVNGFLSKN